MNKLKVVFMGTPEFSVNVLKMLIEETEVIGVVTKPDAPVGRKKVLTESPVAVIAREHNIKTFKPVKLRNEYEEILNLHPDVIITCAYGQIVPKQVLDYPQYGCINVHASLLPKLRGGAPIHRCILEGHSKTGITIMYMSSKMDAGDIITQREIDIDYEDTAESLHDKLSILGRDLLLETLTSIIDGTNTRTPQDESQVTFGYNIKREDELIDFSRTTREIYNKVRGLYSWPGAYTTIDGKILKVWKSRESLTTYPNLFDGQITNIYPDGFGVKTSNGEIILTEVQPEGKKRMSGRDFVNGNKDLVGKMLR